MKCFVLGDTIIDVYLRGAVRPCNAPEGCQVHVESGSEWVPGGAALVARQLAILGNEVTLQTHLGDDFEGHVAAELLEQEGVRLILKQNGRSSKKVRYLDGRRCILRADFAQPVATAELQPEAYESDIIVVSDYGLGSVGALPSWEFEAHKPRVYVDPYRGRHPRHYGRVCAITPCMSEALQCSGMEYLDDAFRVFLRYADTVIVTMGEAGCELRTHSEKHMIPALRSVAVDAVGAGDVFLAVFAAWHTPGNEKRAAEGASMAAAVQIDFLGPQPIPIEDLA